MNMRRIEVDRATALAWLHNFVKTHGHTPSINDLYRHKGCPYSKELILREFGSMRAFLEAGGYPSRIRGQNNRRIEKSDIELLEQLREMIFQCRTTDRDILRRNGLYDRDVYVRRFGSWARAIRLAGIDNRHRVLMRYYDDYNGEDPIEFVRQKIGENGEFTQEQIECIERVKRFNGDPKLVRKHISYDKIRRLFGYVSILLIAAGYEPNVDWNTGIKVMAKDGHMCDSQEEAEIDDFLSEAGYAHDHCVRYPEGRFTCDFAIGDIFIEYAGLAKCGSPKYKATLKRKQAIAKKHGLKLIIVYDTSTQAKMQLRAAIEENLYGKPRELLESP